MKNFLSMTLLFIFLSSVLCCFVALGKVADTVTLNRIVAVVNDDLITQSELNEQVNLVRQQLEAANMTLPSHDVFQKQVLQQLIDKKLQLQAAANMGIHIDNKRLNKALDTLAERNHMTLKELYLSAQQEGWTVEAFREKIREDVTIQELQKREVASRIHISDQEISDFLRSGKNVQEMPTYHLADVLIPLPAVPSNRDLEQAQSQAQAVVEQLKQWADFHQVAIAESSGRRALQGGDLGWRKAPELPVAFAERVQTMKVNDIEGPIRTPNGLHVIKLLGVKHGTVYKTDKENEIQLIFIEKSKSGQEKINKIFKYLRKGVNFSDVAKRYSEDTKTAIIGGYMGWVTLDQFDKLVHEAVAKLAVGEVSDPIVTNGGWYIVKVIARRDVPHITGSEKERIQELLFQRKLNEGLQTFITTLRNESYVKMY